MRHNILICEKVDEIVFEILKQHGISYTIKNVFDEESLIIALNHCDSILVRRLNISRNVIERVPNLKLVAKHGVGCDSIDVECLKKHGIALVSAPGTNSLSVAEHAIMLMLACSRKLKVVCEEYSNGNFDIRSELAFNDLSGKTLGLIGCGAVAREVARIAYKGFDMNVIAYDPFIDPQIIPSYVCKCDNICDVIQNVDYLSIHIPGTKNNDSFFDEKYFKLMKKNAILINTSRGNVINQDDLLKALENNLFAGAGLDVSTPEPLEKTNPLFQNRNVILTPHIAASTEETLKRTGELIALKIVEFYEEYDKTKNG